MAGSVFGIFAQFSIACLLSNATAGTARLQRSTTAVGIGNERKQLHFFNLSVANRRLLFE
jgi:hypothetical protein